MKKSYPIRAYHIAEKIKLKDVRERLSYIPKEFSNYEMVIALEAPNSYMVFHNFGSVVFFNVTEELLDIQMARLAEFRTPSETMRTSDTFMLEVSEDVQNKAHFDRVEVRQLTYDTVKLVSTILAQSTALEYYEILIENLLEKTGRFSKMLQEKGKFLQESEDLIKFIGLCLNMRQDIISNLYIVDSPEEVWENNELERLFIDMKNLFDIDVRYRALEHKIQIIQESVEIIVDLSKTRKSLRLEVTIVILILLEIFLSLSSIFFKFPRS